MFYKDLKIKLLETSSKSKKCKSDYTTMIIFFPINTRDSKLTTPPCSSGQYILVIIKIYSA